MLINDSPRKAGHDQLHVPVRSLGVIQLIAISFFTVSGGPYGIESIVSTAPILIVLLSFIVIPILWSTPVSLITAELSTMMPQDGGSVLWVKEGFGDAVGWINGICSWVVFLFDSALYPSVMLTYVLRLTGDLHPVVQFVLTSAFVSLVLAVNLRSALEVGWLAELLGVVAILPFIVFITYAFTSGDVGPVHLAFSDHPKPDLGLLLSLSIWNSAGWEDVGMLAGEVRNPSRTFPLGLVGSLLLQTICNIVPIYIGFAIDPHYEAWQTGHFATLAHRVGGRGAYVFMLVGAFVSNIGLLHANIVSSSRLVAWMSTQAKSGVPWFPSIFGKLYSKHAVPRAAVVLNCVLIALLTALPFEYLVQADVFIMCLSYVLLFLTFLVLRFRAPLTSRPFRLPAARPFLTFVYIAIPLAIVAIQVATSPLPVLLMGIGVVGGAVVVYLVAFVVYPWRSKRREYRELT